MTEFKVGDRVRDVTEHSNRMGLDAPGEGRISGREYGRYWGIEWDDKRMGPCGWSNDQLELISPAEPTSPIRETTKREIVPNIYGQLKVGEVVSVPDCDGPDVTPDLYVYVNFREACLSASELEAAASVMTQIAAVLRENGK